MYKGKKERKPKSVKETALDYLNYRSRSIHEVESQLKKKGFEAAEIEETILFLQDCDFLNDERFCELYVSYGIEQGRGPLRLQMELQDKGISKSLIQLTLEECYPKKLQYETAMLRARRLLIKKDFESCDFGAGEEAGFESESEPEQLEEKALAKAARRLMYQGFHSSIVYDVLGKIRRERE